MADDERRKTARIRISQLAQSTREDRRTGLRSEAMGTTADLSKGGLRFDVPQGCNVQSGSEVTISFVVGGKIVDAKGDVVHFTSKDEGMASMGIRFKDLSDADRKFIERYCQMRESLE